MSEAGANGRLFASAITEPPPQPDREAGCEVLREALALGSTPVPSGADWQRVRAAVLSEAHVRTASHLRRHRLGWFGLAASAVAYFAFSSGRPEVPEIVFVDLDARPGIEFSILRGGVSR